MSFRPPFWASLLSLLAMLLFGSLANWQYQRGQDKAAMIALRSNQSESGLISVNSAQRIPAYGRRIEVTGRWRQDLEILLDNQTRSGQIGVHVWTPFQLPDSAHLILVDRGWLKSSLYREEWPETGELPVEEQTIVGLWRNLPQAGLATDQGQCADVERWPARLNYPSQALLDCLYAQAVAPGLLLLDAAQPGGFIREWGDLGVPPERHYGYAVQWGAFLLTTLVLYIVLNLKRKSS